MFNKLAYKFSLILFLPKLFKNYLSFKSKGGYINSFNFILSDFNSFSGVMSGHYFHSDLLISSFIFNQNPSKHLDVASRSDGLVAHVASYRPIYFLDVRPHRESRHSNLMALQGDITIENIWLQEQNFDSISCSYALANFGFGRYGETVEPNAHIKAFINMVSILQLNGTIYISLPLTNSNNIVYNSHRSFHPIDPLTWDSRVRLLRMDLVDEYGELTLNVNPADLKITKRMACGIYTFKKYG